MTVRKLQQKRGWAWNLAVPVIKPLLLATTTREWVGGENIPESGGFILALNHVSHVDPLTAAHLVYDHGRLPRYLAKSGLFKSRAGAFFFTAAGQIPVERLTTNAAGAYEAAVDAVRRGECVVVYPEGTITRDPGGWPMTGKSGAARIALATGCPVIPVGQWGAQQLLAPYGKLPDLFPRKRIQMRVGPPVDLTDLLGQPQTTAVVQQATDRIMAAITGLVEEVRGETAPAERFDMRKAGVRQIGNPNKEPKGTTSRSPRKRAPEESA
ncbi:MULTISPECIES: lysophospholipid acyltransferase family protein [unclassified Nocardioides]|uniref:lysophospholipid acyltransferase family protein n=1 Tax=unclassified Nocardioides TaxID=2615069 RepID=UPI00005713B4|nr:MULTISPECIES: lysophospholipid acyltransferase family protein [unclassified Nocardioides]ABL82796.1 phospholipid/glycerol acyltransferase [Nocardioides sp. JS614]